MIFVQLIIFSAVAGCFNLKEEPVFWYKFRQWVPSSSSLP
jgi:hypothetical protein